MQTLLAITLVLLGSTYAGLSSRPIKALSEDDVRSLREGKGMGLALAAELNGYPGPKHVLELADKLALTAEQRAAVQKSYDRMLASATALGGEIVDLEEQLDRAFAAAAIDENELSRLTGAIAERQGTLRNVHLAAHLETRALLTGHQLHVYARARGYGSAGAHH